MDRDLTNKTSSSLPLNTTPEPSLGSRILRTAKRAAVPAVCIGIGVLASVLNNARR